MKLSMSLIANELSGTVTSFHTFSEQKDGLAALKILTPKDTCLYPEYLYLCQPEQLTALLAQNFDITNRNFIIYGENFDSLIEQLEICNYLTISSTASFFHFINTIAAIFSSYNEWESQLVAMSISSASLQDMLDLAYSKIRIPMCILDVNHQVLAVNRQVKTTDPLYLSMQQGYGYPCIEMIHTSNPTLSELDRENVSEVINHVSHNRLRVTTIKTHERPVCYFGLHKPNAQPFAPYTLELYDFFVTILTFKAAMLPEELLIKSSLFEQFMADLILDKYIAPNIFSQLTDYFQYDPSASYSLFAIAFTDALTKRQVILKEFMNLAEAQIPGCKCFYLEPYVGILLHGAVLPAHIQRLKNVLRGYVVHCVYSYCFRELRNIKKAWRQLIFALDHWETEHGTIQNCDHYIHRLCVQTIHHKLPPETLLHPYFLVLSKYDKENNTEYLQTLISYLQNNCSISAAANDLYIHRNSLQYRIRKIEELLDIRISSTKEHLSMLFSSFFIST
ncbi:MAG: hypothetical protein HFG80_02555 [Eubacterium sp.]|nr:hypothetical protein [Eubacterium sp.]